MKLSIFTSVSALALIAAAPAFAQSNTSAVNQTGTNAKALVKQTGANSGSTVFQASDLNDAKVTQSGLTGSDSSVSQTGARNKATVTQSDDNTGYDPTQTSSVNQSGSDNIADVIQTQRSSFGSAPGTKNSSAIN